jgi:hypothetical protein
MTDQETIERLRREITDAQYMLRAYMQMLGPKGLQVAEMWLKNGVRRVHFDWGPEAYRMTGEERAQFILDLENAPKTLIEKFDD